MNIIEVRNVTKVYNKKNPFVALKNVSLNVKKGEFLTIVGPSGSGKTTILRMIAGLEQPDSGEIIIDGKVVNDIPASERGIGFVFQSKRRCFIYFPILSFDAFVNG